MSEYYTQVVRIEKLEPHPNADTLDIATVLGSYPVIVKRGEFQVGGLAAYFSVDAMVPVACPSFSFLASRSKGKSHHRIRAMKLRGVFSMGLLVPCPQHWSEGENVASYFGVVKYETASEAMEKVVSHNATRKAKASETAGFDAGVIVASLLLSAVCIALLSPWLAFLSVLGWSCLGMTAMYVFRRPVKLPNIPVYDIEGFRKHSHVIQPNEEVIITEKIHGMNSSYVHTGRKFHSKSRTRFRPKAESDRWWRIADRFGLAEKLKRKPNMVLFGEVFGKGVQDLEYGRDDIDFRAFDVMNLHTREFLNHCDFVDFCIELGIPYAPVLYRGPWGETCVNMAEGQTTLTMNDHIREGIVIRPIRERHEHGLGRCLLKLAGEAYLTRKEKDE